MLGLIFLPSFACLDEDFLSSSISPGLLVVRFLILLSTTVHLFSDSFPHVLPVSLSGFMSADKLLVQILCYQRNYSNFTPLLSPLVSVVLFPKALPIWNL